MDLNALKALRPQPPQREPAKAEPLTTGARVEAIWRELLARGPIDHDENFFDAGGHSLRVAALQQRLAEAFSFGLSLTDIFEYPTIRSQAERLVRLARQGHPGAAPSAAPEPPSEEPAAAVDTNAIAIIGMVGRFPAAPDVETFWEKLLNGYEAGAELNDNELLALGVAPELLRQLGRSAFAYRAYAVGNTRAALIAQLRQIQAPPAPAAEGGGRPVVYLFSGQEGAFSALVRNWEEGTEYELRTARPHPQGLAAEQAALLYGIGSLWALGAGIDWERLHAPHRPRRVALPTYPFQRRRHWLARPAAALQPAATAFAAAMPAMACRREGGVASLSFSLCDKDWFIDEHRIFEGQGVARRNGEFLVSVITRGLRAARTLQACNAASAVGLLGAVSQEFPNLVCRHIDLEDITPPIQSSLIAELRAGHTDAAPAQENTTAHHAGASVALGNARREIPGFTPMAEPAAGAGLRHAGVYLITGGLGGMGFELARDIATIGSGVKLGLISRSGGGAAGRAQVAELEALGANG